MNRNERNCGTCVYAQTLHTEAPCRGCWLDKGLPNYQFDGKVRQLNLDAVTTTGTYQPIEPPKPKTYLTTYNPYMSKDWKTTCGELAREYYGHFDVNSLYPAEYIRQDGFNITQYILDEFHIPEEEWKKRECEMDAMRNCFQSKMPNKEKEKSMYILIHRQLVTSMNECMIWVRNKLSEAGVSRLVSIKYNGRIIETDDRSLTIHFISGDNKSGAVGIRPNYYISDTTEMTEYLRTRGGEELTSVYKACELAIEHLKEKEKNETEHDWTGYSPTELLDDMKTILNRRKCCERYFDNDEWFWVISVDVRDRLRTLFAFDCSAHPTKIFGIAVNVDGCRLNYLKLKRKDEKEKNEMNMNLAMNKDVTLRYNDGTEYKARVNVVNWHSDEPTSMELHLLDENPVAKAHNTSKNDIVAHNTWEVENLVEHRFPGARVYIQYNSKDIRLECAVVMDSYNTVEFAVRCDRAMSSHDASELSIAIRRDFEVLNRISRNRLNSVYGRPSNTLPTIKDVKFEDPATIVFWNDGTKTVVRAQGEAYDPEKGLAMAISRKAMGNKREYYHVFLRWLKKFRKQKFPAYPEDMDILLNKED